MEQIHVMGLGLAALEETERSPFDMFLSPPQPLWSESTQGVKDEVRETRVPRCPDAFQVEVKEHGPKYCEFPILEE